MNWPGKHPRHLRGPGIPCWKLFHSRVAIINTLLGVAVLLTILVACAAAQRDRAAEEEPTAAINFVVLKDDNGKAVRNAAIIMHPVNTHGKQERGGMELKTDAEGKSNFDGVPYGKLRVQVLASGFQTFGEDYDIRQPKIDLTIRLKRPQGQYSVYEDHPGAKKDDKPAADPNRKPQ